MRNDGLLYTGVTSRTARKLSEEKKVLKRIDKEQKLKLQTGADIVLDAIKKEKEQTVAKMLQAIDTNTPEDQVKTIIVSLNLYKDSLNSLSAKIKNIMREVWTT